ncbi:hypothetical protein ACFE04_012436 [Oxalis oulophora]
MSPYAGSMYHGSPLLLSLLGPLTVTRIEGQPDNLLCRFYHGEFYEKITWSLNSATERNINKETPKAKDMDIISAILIRATGQNLQKVYSRSLRSLDLDTLAQSSEILSCGNIAALVYLWNPFTIVSCVGLSTSPIENLAVILALYGASTRKVPLAAFGWVTATHLSLYPATLIIPIILMLGYGPDAPRRKLFLENKCNEDKAKTSSENQQRDNPSNVEFSWKQAISFLLWASAWSAYVLVLCRISVKQYGGLKEMFKSTYGFILTVEDLSPNIGVLWYFFAEVFEFFRSFFLIVFHSNIMFMVLPLAIRLNHRPCFLAFVYIAISSILKSYPSVGDSALYLGLLSLFVNELSDVKFSFFIFCGYVGVSLLSPVMHNLWIWRGTGNANFYYATAMAYACFQNAKKTSCSKAYSPAIGAVCKPYCHATKIQTTHTYVRSVATVLGFDPRTIYSGSNPAQGSGVLTCY